MHKNWKRLTLTLAAGLLATSLAPEVATAKSDPGKKVYMRKTCLACHGRNGAKAIQDYPNLAGQNAKYMIQQINDILSGKRKGSPDATGNPRSEGMRGALVTPEGKVRLSKEEIKAVSVWLSKQPPPAPKAPKEPLSAERLDAGKALYKKKKCKNCHGVDGKKPINKSYPFIAGQKKNYIVAQMTDMKKKIRKNGKSKTMYSFVKKLTDEEIALLADFLSQVDRTASK